MTPSGPGTYVQVMSVTMFFCFSGDVKNQSRPSIGWLRPPNLTIDPKISGTLRIIVVLGGLVIQGELYL